MSKASKIVVLCEDKAHEVFARRFLKKGWGIINRHITIIDYPVGKSSGKKHVEDSLNKEATALRQRHASSILIVMRDADEDSLEEAVRKLESRIQPPRGNSDPIVFVAPKWHIQTWIGFLAGEEIDESDKQTYENAYGTISKTKQAHQFVDKLADWCKRNKAPESLPNSLKTACAEFERIRSAL